ncbi:MAG: nitrous oxide reductase accessory protein NosL [Calditrichaceae bacterium]|nr:nitrous oxide reductase accessory protein NosL [Calditrichaceae bacterium]
MTIRFIILLGSIFLIFACEKKTEVTPIAKESTITQEEHRCANCGMYTHIYPNWEQKVISGDKGTMYFDGARCMFKILLDSTTAPKHIEEIQVKDYYSLQYIDGTKAFYVIGSDVLGPMGNELIPFETKSAAEEFLKDHKGEKIVLFDEVDMPLIMKLVGKMRMK